MELLDRMRARGYDVPVILLTGRGSYELDLEAMEMGAFDYVEKADLTPRLLERAIRYTMENHRARAALRKANEELERRVRERTAELHRSNLELQQFANIVARDLQQPLQAITSHIEKMKARGAERGDERGAERGLRRAYRFLDPVLRAARNMELLVQSVLDYSSVGTETTAFGMVDLSGVVKEVRAELESAITEAGAEIEVGDLPSVQGNHKLLKGLFENLIDNAVRFRGERPLKICVSSERKDDVWLCTVSDNGVGIDDEDTYDIFLMFHKGARETDYPGVGIGLAMCRKIVQYHGGKIWVDSEPGRGTTFFFTLPAAA
jgi:light-regulated signal transduction histidine kinase (bacteriophytochrome)